MRITAIIILSLSLSACELGGSVGETQRASVGAAGNSQPGTWCAGRARGHNAVEVETRNMYLGADLIPALLAENLDQFLAATTAIWEMVQQNDFDTRVEALADEIADERPALVGLQEAVTWQTRLISDDTATVVYDYVPQLIAALAARGLHYRMAGEVTLTDLEAPTLLGIYVRLIDHDAILARRGVKTGPPVEEVYSTLLQVPLYDGSMVTVKRGYVAVDASYHHRRFEFVDTHLEAYNARIRTAQASELAEALRDEHLPIILVGDLNSEPGTEGEAVLAEAGFQDVWPELYHHAPGFTCCWPEDLHETKPGLSQRIDYVLTRGRFFPPRAADITGNHRNDRVGGLWPSDHAGLFAEFGQRRRRVRRRLPPN